MTKFLGTYAELCTADPTDEYSEYIYATTHKLFRKRKTEVLWDDCVELEAIAHSLDANSKLYKAYLAKTMGTATADQLKLKKTYEKWGLWYYMADLHSVPSNNRQTIKGAIRANLKSILGEVATVPEFIYIKAIGNALAEVVESGLDVDVNTNYDGAVQRWKNKFFPDLGNQPIAYSGQNEGVSLFPTQPALPQPKGKNG